MVTQSATPQPHPLTDQPTGWPLFFLLPQTRYVRRQRAANAPHYHALKRTVVAHYDATSKKQTYYQRCIQGITTARGKAWMALKRFGRQVAHKLVKWCLLPVAIAASFSMIDAAPAELPERHFTADSTAQVRQ